MVLLTPWPAAFYQTRLCSSAQALPLPPRQASALSLAISQIKDICACQTLSQQFPRY